MDKIDEIIKMLKQVSNTDYNKNYIDAIFWFVKRLLG